MLIAKSVLYFVHRGHFPFSQNVLLKIPETFCVKWKSFFSIRFKLVILLVFKKLTNWRSNDTRRQQSGNDNFVQMDCLGFPF